MKLDVIIEVTDDVEVGMILGGWGVDRPILIRSDGIVCSNNHSSQDGLDPSWHPSWYPNLMPKYPQVCVSFSILYNC